MEWLDLIIEVLKAIVIIVPLVVALVNYVKKAIKEKNWAALLNIVMRYMALAEDKFETGAERKEWVLAMVEEAAVTVNYNVDMTVISGLIDELCAVSKQINVKK